MNTPRSTFSFFVIVMLALAGCASGTAIVTGMPKPPVSPQLVKVYLEPPLDAEIIGLVSASSDAGWTEQGSVDYAIAELKKQAAKLGANGVLLMSSGDKTTTVLGGQGTGFVYAVPIVEKTVQGRAIYVKEQ